MTPAVLRWEDGHLYTVVATQLEHRLTSIPETGGQSQTLEVGVWHRGLWTENGNVIFLGAGPPVDRPDGTFTPLAVKSIPAGGGPSQVLATVGDPATTFFLAWALDADRVYWVEGPAAKPAMVWTAPRAGGDRQLLALLDTGADLTLFDEVTPVGEDLVVYPRGLGLDVPVFRIPKAGGEAHRLPTAWRGARLIAVANDGTVLVQRLKTPPNGEPGSERFETGRLRPGGEAVEPFWSDQPPSLLAQQGWDDGEGGFYVAAWEWGPNESIHLTMWTVDGAGHGRRLACDPLVQGQLTAAAASPDGIYGIVRPSNTSDYWSIVKIGG